MGDRSKNCLFAVKDNCYCPPHERALQGSHDVPMHTNDVDANYIQFSNGMGRLAMAFLYRD